MGRLLLRMIFLGAAIYLSSFVTAMFGLKFEVALKTTDDYIRLAVAILLLAFLNATLGKILKLLTMPLTCLTLGLFSLVINAGIFWLVGSLTNGFVIDGFPAAFVGSLCVSLINGILQQFVPDKDKDDD